ncbi:uncharacterized protein K444DRAFT_689162 [Hyaloscypha bicolor E]|uniref:Uncharacterized protein n=1 Tax=Hyaloscypha bicolor E TaxID=1095630 RepID=A0A2J6TV19_9HELO|nr:uncharacterized protein K444DRAFT_689162 [Hyaloscypha bicolor E]PMD66884.1 hypothetical protein K444DRAFT_689162 [Hyaloscypha bicolor E]
MLKAEDTAMLFKPPHMGAIKQPYSSSSIIKPKSMLKAEDTATLFKLPHLGAIKQPYSSSSIIKLTLMLKAEDTAMLFKPPHMGLSTGRIWGPIKQPYSSSSIIKPKSMLKAGGYGNALQAAAFGGNKATVQLLLLDNKAEVNAQGGDTTAMLFKLPYVGAIKQPYSSSPIIKPKSCSRRSLW